MNITEIEKMKTIEKNWFSGNRIYMKTEQGDVFSRPLEVFPLLKNVTDSERENFKIGKFKDDIRWENLDEDIHISIFFRRRTQDKFDRRFFFDAPANQRFFVC